MADVKLRKEVSTTESCGFIAYFLCFPLGLLYIFWAFVPEKTLHLMNITYYPPKSLAFLIPTFTVLGIMSIPPIYALLNYLSAPSYTSRDTLWDGHSREFDTIVTTSKKKEGSSIPETFDLDVRVINNSLRCTKMQG
mmetsp:Transcript_7212/g.10549  ORF Transcript_7212/g.10549 Transcript_7212/m.10549 type:complete len:137 (-) Transcript_7212:198-608(-)